MISYRIGSLLRKLGWSDMDSFEVEHKLMKFEDWLRRHPITMCMITFDPVFDNKYHKYSCGIDEFRIASTSGIWRKTFIFKARAKME